MAASSSSCSGVCAASHSRGHRPKGRCGHFAPPCERCRDSLEVRACIVPSPDMQLSARPRIWLKVEESANHIHESRRATRSGMPSSWRNLIKSQDFNLCRQRDDC